MLVSGQDIRAEGLLQIAVPVEVIHRVEVGSVVPVLKGSVGEIMIQIGVPVISEGLLEIRIFLPVFDQVYQPVHVPAFREPVGHEMLQQSRPVISKRLQQVRIVLRIISFIKNILYALIVSCRLDIIDAGHDQRTRSRHDHEPSSFFCCPCQFFPDCFCHCLVFLSF